MHRRRETKGSVNLHLFAALRLESPNIRKAFLAGIDGQQSYKHDSLVAENQVFFYIDIQN